MKAQKIIALSSLCLLCVAAAAGAWYTLAPKDEIAEAFCIALSNPKSYKKSDMEHYSYLIKGTDGWVFRTENDFRNEWAVSKKTADYMLALQAAFKKHNADLVILVPPARGMVHKDRLTEKQIKKFAVGSIDNAWKNYETSINDLRAKGLNVVGLDKASIKPDFYYKRDHHWTASGASVMAEKAAAYVKTLDSYAQIPRVEFVTTELSPVEHNSSFEKAFKKICNSDLPKEITPYYETTEKSETSDETSLFGEAAEPQIVLLGTSNSLTSSSHANFEGFLKQDLSSDILNISYAGAGIDTSIVSFVNSPHFRNGLPKIVIWEVPGYYDFNVMDDKLFNQIIPATYGECSAHFVENKNFRSLSSGTTVLFDLSKEEGSGSATSASAPVKEISFSTDAKKKDWNSLYIHLLFSESMADKFSLRFHYEDGRTARQDFERSDRYPSDGDFYTLFPSSDSPLKRITMQLPDEDKDLPEDLEVQICPLPDNNAGQNSEKDGGTAKSM